VLRQLRRRSLATLRREIEPVEPEALARFLPAWHGIGSDRRGSEALVEALGLLAGAPLVASTIERDLLPARVAGYRAAALDELCTSGEVIWVGAGAIGQRDGRIRLCFADQVALLAPGWETPDAPDGEVHDAIRAALAATGASFWAPVRAAVVGASDAEVLAALWDLVWAGEVTNDSMAPLRAALAGGVTAAAARRSARTSRAPRPGRLARLGPPASAGRWSLVAPLLLPVPSPTEAAHAQALQLLERHGVVTREAVLAEGVVGGYASVYGVLKVLEERGRARRGYFVSGLGAAQFALPGAVDRLRSEREPEPDDPVLVLAATDPAHPYVSTLPWPAAEPAERGRAARTTSAVVVSAGGVPLVWFERSSHHLVTFPAAATDPRWAAALADLVRRGAERSVEVRKVDGEPVSGEIADVLRTAGFVDGYRGLVLRAA
jgi:ATP-dependent Lhr-like helicase